MTEKPKMTLADLACHLRQRLLVAREQQNQSELNTLWGIFAVLAESAEFLYPTRDGRAIGLFTEFEYSARDSVMGDGWKGNIPTVEDIMECVS